jgi:hypothetical protein
MIKRLILVLSTIFAIGITSSCCVWHGWWYPKTYEYALRLADDASLPESKAQYLREYVAEVNSITGPPRYIFTRPDLNLAKQKDILNGLIKRFDDISKLEPSSMAYQQGMFQLTGQEMDNQLKRITGIFEDAIIREYPILFFFFWILSWPLWAFTLIVGVCVVEE